MIAAGNDYMRVKHLYIAAFIHNYHPILQPKAPSHRGHVRFVHQPLAPEPERNLYTLIRQNLCNSGQIRPVGVSIDGIHILFQGHADARYDS
jgi:hypothetical protein